MTGRRKVRPLPPPCYDPNCTCPGRDKPGVHYRPQLTAAAVKPKYAKYLPKVRTLCDDCIQDIHVQGFAVAPPPRPVRWRRTDANGSIRLCEKHKESRQENE